MEIHKPMPVKGYTSQTGENLLLVNRNKYLEEGVLVALDVLAANPAIDKRWLAVARTQIELGFMAMNRAIFKPVRLGEEEG